MINSQQGESSDFSLLVYWPLWVPQDAARPSFTVPKGRRQPGREERERKRRIMGNGPTLREVAEGGLVVWTCER